MNAPSGKTVVVVGASRGLGRGIASALADAGAEVIGISRTKAESASSSGAIHAEIADAADPVVAAGVIDRYRPDVVILAAGATPHMRPLQQQTWESFSVNWHTDVRIAFHWLREALLTPLQPGSRVIVVSSGAAANPNGSPLSGGYAGAKATQRFIAGYAQDEAARAGLDITFTTVLPFFAPTTGIGHAAVRAYAARAGVSVDQFLRQQPPPVTPEIAGTAAVELVRADVHTVASAYRLTGVGLREVS